MSAPRRFLRRLVRFAIMSALIGFVRGRLLDKNQAKYGPESRQPR